MTTPEMLTLPARTDADLGRPKVVLPVADLDRDFGGAELNAFQHWIELFGQLFGKTDGSSADSVNVFKRLVTLEAGGALLSGVISPTTIATHQTDYAPTGYASAAIWRLTASATYSIYSMAAGTSGQLRLLVNIGSFAITLSHDHTSGTTAAQRFDLPSATDVSLAAGASALCIYDATTARWRIVGGSGGGTVDFTAVAAALAAASASVAVNSQKITGLANGSSSSDAAAFGQIPTGSASTPGAVSTTGAAGSAATWSKSDHVHAITAATVISAMASAASALGMNSQKITGLAAGTATGDAARYDELQAAKFPGVVTEATNARTLSDADNGKVILFTRNGGCTVTVPDSLTASFSCVLVVSGTGAGIVFAASGTQVLKKPTAFDSACSAAEASCTVVVFSSTRAQLGGALDASGTSFAVS